MSIRRRITVLVYFCIYLKFTKPTVLNFFLNIGREKNKELLRITEKIKNTKNQYRKDKGIQRGKLPKKTPDWG